jgi:nitrogen fixation protein FixH
MTTETNPMGARSAFAGAANSFAPPQQRGREFRAAAPCDGSGATARPLTGRTVLAALLGFFAVIIGVNGVMIALAIGTMPGVGSEKPYQAGVAYNAEIEAARAQAARRWKVASHISRDAQGRAIVSVKARDSNGTPIGGLAVAVRLLRPADQRGDRTMELREREAGTYLGEAADVAAGAWEVEIDAARASERLFRSRNRILLE